ncbi:spore coat associated protein CotJA [Clostridium uliginosum]|uniref:Spore coat associated protein JA (CotJA) n=1 Tax=Clostridium uliginosum TaxID=119641 RepID=A0A1I1PUE5_9CLOT|nr:spore coat associated protein CotJA [Clostridium uliginosum]SFD13476.1 Spore coat associated protein JA (CotJA) [Clostridium uliginosum]
MYRHDDYLCKPKEYARAYILPQIYENLFSCKEGFDKGTLFKDLYQPYHQNKKNKC